MQIIKYQNSLLLDLIQINFYFKLCYLFNPQQWCQKWDKNTLAFISITFVKKFAIPDHLILFQIHSVTVISSQDHLILFQIHLAAVISSQGNLSINYKHIYLLHFDNILNNDHILPLHCFPINNSIFKNFKIRHDLKLYSLSLDTSQTIFGIKLIIGKIIGYHHTEFYLTTHSKYLSEPKMLGLYNIGESEIAVIHRLKGGGETFDDIVLTTTQSNIIHRPFFLIKTVVQIHG